MCRLFKLMCVAVLLSSLSKLAFPQEPAAAIHREAIEWLDVYVPTESGALPRVLLIGDSITRLYYPGVQERLRGRAVVGRLSTSKCAGDPALLEEIRLVLTEQHFDLIQLNNGMHGWEYSSDAYRRGVADLRAELMRDAPTSRVVVATTTPVRTRDHLTTLDARTEIVRERNAIMRKGFPNAPVDDLFALMLPREDGYSSDGVHPNSAGTAVMAQAVSDFILAQLNPDLKAVPSNATSAK